MTKVKARWDAYYRGASDALNKMDSYLQSVHKDLPNGKCRKLVEDIGWALEAIITEFGVDNAKRLRVWPTGARTKPAVEDS